MDGGNKVVELRQSRESGSSPYLPDSGVLADLDEEFAPKTGRWRRPLALAGCSLAALGWIGTLGFARYNDWAGRAPSLEDVISLIATASAPLALIAVVWMLLLRSSRAETSRFARTAHALRTESERLDTVLTFVTARIDASRRELGEQGDSLLNIGDDAARRLKGVTDAMRKEIETVSSHAHTLKGTAAAARGDLAVLLSHLPKAQVQMRQIAASLVEAGNTAQDKAVALSEQLALLGAQGTDARELAAQSADDLARQLERMVDSSNQLAGLVSDSEARLREAGGDATEKLAARIQQISAEVDRIAAGFSSNDEASRALLTRVSADLGELESRFAAFDVHGRDRADQMSDTLAQLHDRATSLQSALAAGDGNLDTLRDKSEALLAALDNAAREIDETIPAAYGRLEVAAGKALDVVQRTSPAIASWDDLSKSSLDRLANAEQIVARQQERVSELDRTSANTLTALRREIEDLVQSVDEASHRLADVTQGASAGLVESLVRARETARQAAENARDTFNDVIPATAASFGEQSKKALGEALTEQVEAQMTEIAATTERAVAAAQKATDRLMRQMLTISETSAALEARIAEAKEDVERNDHSNFARRVALLIESLNSNAIDVTKLLSNDVTDTAWAAYLRGDRGIFARRAVKLLETNEAKEISRHYQEDSDFREQVNRYIHDYESMLRTVMSTRDGTPLSVALLSADTGKLYVALAQAIERLRT